MENLEWVTYKENTEHAIRTGLYDPHKKHPKCPIVINEVPESPKPTQKEIDEELYKSMTPILNGYYGEDIARLRSALYE